MITIVDYQMGNLRSVQKAIEKVGGEAEITGDPAKIATAEKLILPGVGAFRDAIAHLKEAGLVVPIRQFIDSGRPFLGICLGLQLLFAKSHEDGEHAGLGVFPGEVVRFDSASPAMKGLKVPHMGWNQLQIKRCPPLLEGLGKEPNVYFVHSYYVVPDDPAIVATTTDYGIPFTSMIWKENVYAAQFHPEKSQTVGLSILQRFAEI